VRWEESQQRKGRKPFEIVTAKKEDRKLFNDNDEERRLFENCMQKGKRVVNPAIDWLGVDVWEFIKSEIKIPYCSLYDEGYERLGCVGCPMSCNRVRDFERWPKYYHNYYKAVQRFLPGYLERCRAKKRTPYKKNSPTVDGLVDLRNASTRSRSNKFIRYGGIIMNITVDIDVAAKVDINAEIIREAIKKDLVAICTPATFGSEYLDKLEELEKTVDEMEFDNLIEAIEENTEVVEL
jgi:3'-phosphoadenosine 5'-phosphosulfate sulfotransferase (PAPS reductase)/FAD synthetase